MLSMAIDHFQSERRTGEKKSSGQIAKGGSRFCNQAAGSRSVRIVKEQRGGDSKAQSLRVKKKARRLEQLLKPEILVRLMDELGADDRQPPSMTIGQLQAFRVGRVRLR